MSKWTVNNIPDLTGQVMIVTGANSGLGYETSKALAQKRATVILACRNLEKGEAAQKAILRAVPEAALRLMKLDLSSLAAIGAFVDAFKQEFQALNVLINNAGVMALPRRQTADGFEMQFGTNHLGHFALTGLLLELLQATPSSRVVTVSSGLHQRGRLNFDDLHGEKGYGRWQAYSNSKLANLYFAYELQRRLSKTGSATISVAAHPGYSATNLQSGSTKFFIEKWFLFWSNKLVAQSAAMGALPQLVAAVSPDVEGGDYFGPDGFNEMRGYPKKVRSSSLSYDKEIAQKLWQVSEDLTDIRFL